MGHIEERAPGPQARGPFETWCGSTPLYYGHNDELCPFDAFIFCSR